MASLKANVFANFGGQALAMVIGLAFVPIYIRILGIESYGLLGFFLSLQAFFLILDMGLSAALNRELARDSYTGRDTDDRRDLVRTLEWLYWPVGLLIAFIVFAMSGPISASWLKPTALTVSQTANAVVLMGVAAALQWPIGLYSGGFRGLERQVELNVLNAAFAVMRSIGAVGILVLVSPTLEAFLWWHIFIGVLHTFCSAIIFWQMLPPGTRSPRFSSHRLLELRGFALGMAAIVALSFVLMHSDKLILSNLLPLGDFGYYTVASTVAAALSSVVQPFFAALYPRYSGLVANGDHSGLTALYHRSNQLIVVAVVPVASVLAFFSSDVLRLWTGDPQLASRSGPILSVLVAGTALNGLMNLPYALQLAHGWTRLALYQNLVAVALVVPSTWWLAREHGSLGAASVWVALNLGYFAIGVPLMHRKLLRQEMGSWYRRDILPPALAAIGAAAVAKIIAPPITGLAGIVMLAAIGLACLSIAVLFSPAARAYLPRLRRTTH